MLHAIFSSDKGLQEFFFRNHPPPPPSRVKWSAPKPRMCHDERLLNLRIKDLPLSLDYISNPLVMCFMGISNRFLTKSGYDHVLLSPENTTYFGLAWNDADFNFCQWCGFRSEVLADLGSRTKLVIDVAAIDRKLDQLRRQRSNKSYERQKIALHKLLSRFLASLPLKHVKAWLISLT